MSQKHYVPAFHFRKDLACYCRSGLNFGDCCAKAKEVGMRPRGITVVNNFLSSTDCNSLIRFAEKQKREWLMVVDKVPSKDGKLVTKRHRHPTRVTQRVILGRKQKVAEEHFRVACEEYISRYSNVKAQWYEPPQLLRYELEGKYGIHADAENICSETNRFYRFIDRDFSMLIYLNDDYEGGDLYFQGLDFQYKPAQGDLVIFPSNHVFSHESLPIKSGKKYALVSWGAYIGSERVSSPRQVLAL